MSPPSTLAPVRPLFRAITRAAVPASEAFDDARWSRAEEIVDGALADRPSGVRRQVVLFVRVVDTLARVRFGRGLGSLPVARVRTLMGSLERAPVPLLRRGLWGVRTLAFMGCYAQDGVREALGYRAAAGGWGARGHDGGPWPDRKGAGPPETGTLVAGEEAEPGHA
jgi:hypothetical protein